MCGGGSVSRSVECVVVALCLGLWIVWWWLCVQVCGVCGGGSVSRSVDCVVVALCLGLWSVWWWLCV